MCSVNSELHIFFFPLLLRGHMIPMVDMATLFASRGVKSTIITTQLNATLISQTLRIRTITINLPWAEFGLPQDYEIADSNRTLEMLPIFFKATTKLQHPLEQLLLQERPQCLVADMFYPWATDSAAKFSIPRLVFHGFGFFPRCASLSVALYEPYKNVTSDSEAFLIPNLPGDIKMTRKQLTELNRIEDDDKTFTRLLKEARESEVRSYGVVVNSFYEMEQPYADHYRKALGRRAWHIGPVSLCIRDIQEKATRGMEASIDEHLCLSWLDSKQPNSAVYVCFGSMADVADSQLKQIAMGLEASGQNFIWVVRKSRNDEEDKKEDWMPEGYEKRMGGKGLIIRGWAPQVLILEHEAVGGFVTHCGWNSVLEGVSAGVPMVTWPLYADQFYNEKLVTEILKIGVPVGAQIGDHVKKDAIVDAVNRIMRGEEAEQLRNKAKLLAHKARQAVDVGGSSYSDFHSLIQELHSFWQSRLVSS